MLYNEENDLDLLCGYCINSLKHNKTKLQNLEEQKIQYEEKFNLLKAQLQQIIKSEESYKQAIDILYEKSFKDLENKINSFLSKIFTDRHYRIFFTPETLRGSKTVNIELQSGEIISIPEDFGGSQETAIGLAFRIIYVLQTGYPILFLDETLADINDTYVYNLLDFLKQLGKEFGIEFVIITHNEKIADLADVHYHVGNKTYTKV